MNLWSRAENCHIWHFVCQLWSLCPPENWLCRLAKYVSRSANTWVEWRWWRPQAEPTYVTTSCDSMKQVIVTDALSYNFTVVNVCDAIPANESPFCFSVNLSSWDIIFRASKYPVSLCLGACYGLVLLQDSKPFSLKQDPRVIKCSFVACKCNTITILKLWGNFITT